MIQLFKHKVSQQSIDNVTNVLKSGWTGLGAMTESFEMQMKTYLDTPFVVGLNSGTAALQIALSCLSVPKGSYIITTPLTFISTNHCIKHAGYFPVFADIEPDTGNISIDSIKRLIEDKFIGPRVKGIMVVHYGGLPVDMDEIYDISNHYQIDVIEDAAHAFGSEYKENKIGCKYSRFVAFSFHSVKPLALGDGGALTTYDPTVDAVARQLRWCGIDKSTRDRFKAEGYRWDYDVKYTGFKCHMNDIMAAIGLGQLTTYPEEQKYRAQLVELYRELLEDSPVQLLRTFPDRVSSNHLFVILCNSREHRDTIVDYLFAKDIQTGVHYRLSTMYKMYKNAETDNGCPNAVTFFDKCITLPLHLDLTPEDIKTVCDAIKEAK